MKKHEVEICRALARYADSAIKLIEDGEYVKTIDNGNSIIVNRVWFESLKKYSDIVLDEITYEKIDDTELGVNETGRLPDGEYNAVWHLDQLQIKIGTNGYNFLTGCNTTEYIDCIATIENGLLQSFTVEKF